jgi:hypothetical protein
MRRLPVERGDAPPLPPRDNSPMRRLHCLAALLGAALAPGALACDSDTPALFACEAAQSRKFIELCASSQLDAKTGSLQYRFGSLTKDGQEKAVELEFPASLDGSLKRFVAATYTHAGVYTQSVGFVSGNFRYTVFTKARGTEVLDAGVAVRDTKSGKTTTISCSENPRFYIYDLKGLVACDPDTPVGTACVR